MPDPEGFQESWKALLTDMSKEKQKPLDDKPREAQWQIVTLQMQLDQTTPSPEYTIKVLRANVSTESVNSIDQQLSGGRLSWGQRFYEVDGHQVVFSLMAQMAGKLNSFECLTPAEGELCQCLLGCARNMLNSSDGSAAIVGGGAANIVPIINRASAR
jgi:hypothetical protein